MMLLQAIKKLHMQCLIFVIELVIFGALLPEIPRGLPKLLLTMPGIRDNLFVH